MRGNWTSEEESESHARNGLSGRVAIKSRKQGRKVCSTPNYTRTGFKIRPRSVMNPNLNNLWYVCRRSRNKYNSERLGPSVKHGGGSVMVLAFS